MQEELDRTSLKVTLPARFLVKQKMVIRKSSFVAIIFVLLTASPVQGFAGFNIHPEFQETTFTCTSNPTIIRSTSFLSRNSSIIAGKFTAISASTENNPLEDVSSEASSENIDWKEISESVFSKDKRPVILFDGVCNLCNGGVNFALDNDSVGKLKFFKSKLVSNGIGTGNLRH